MNQYIYDITVVVCSYNPNLKKLISTLKSIVLQKNVKMQVLISDDGSKVNYKDEIESFFSDYSTIDYKIIINEKNVGTVNNIYNAIRYATGKYTYIISPGDYFFSEDVLSKIYCFSEKKNITIAFGKAQYYSNDGTLRLYNQMDPRSPEIYNLKWLSKETKKLAYCTNQGIVGACFFRRTDVLLEYINRIKDYSKYDEDNGTTYVHLLEKNGKINFLNDFVVWYEFGTGISTSNNQKFLNELEKDCTRVLQLIKNKRNERIIDYMDIKNRSFFRHPILKVKSYLLRILGKIYEYKKFEKTGNDFFYSIAQ